MTRIVLCAMAMLLCSSCSQGDATSTDMPLTHNGDMRTLVGH